MRISSESARRFEELAVASGGTVQYVKMFPVDPPEPIKHGKRKRPPLVMPSVTLRNGRLIAMIPVRTVSEINQRAWKARARRSKEAWAAVRAVLGNEIACQAYAEHYRTGGHLQVIFTRLGGRKVDRSNLPTCTKFVEDALAGILGANDGSCRWKPSWEQKPGSGPVGVQIELRMI